MARIDPRITIEEFLESHDIEYERQNGDTFLVTLPGEKKLQTHCALVVGDHSLSINAFIIRKPDENQEQVFAWCLSKNASMYGVAFAINELGISYRQLKDYANAIEQFKKTVELDEKFAIGWYNLGEAEFRNGNIKEAKKAHEKLRPLNRNMANALEIMILGAKLK